MTKDQCIAIIDALAVIAKYNARIKVAVENKPFNPDALEEINSDFDSAVEEITEAIPDDPAADDNADGGEDVPDDNQGE